MNKILTIAALALVLSACSNEDNDIQTPVEQPAKSEAGGIPFTATISIGESAMTRALTEDATNNQIIPTWVAGEKVALIHNGVKDEMTVSAVNAGVATITGTITGSPSGSDAVTIIYPSDAADGTTGNVKSDWLSSQVGTLEGTSGTSIEEKYDVRKGSGALNASGTSLDGTVSLTNQNAIFKLTLKDIDGTNDVSATSVVISDQTGVVTTVTPASGYENAMYVALPTTATTLKFLVTGSDSKKYFNMASSLSLGASYYQSTVKLATVGDVILSTGKCAKAGTSGAVAKICYLGDETGESAYNYTNGLALALSDASTGCKWKTSNDDAGHTKQTSSTFTEESGLQYNATFSSRYPAFKAAITYSPAAPTGCSAWFLASGYQWKKMIDAAGLSNLGLSSALYWSSSERDATTAWQFGSSNGIWYIDSKGVPFRVRACLAF